MDTSGPHTRPFPEARAPRRPIATAALCAALVACIYHIPGTSVAADALRAAAAAAACLAVLVGATRGEAATAQGVACRPPVPRTVAALVLACALAMTAAGLAGTGAAPTPGAWAGAPGAAAAACAVLAVSCLGTAVWEELLFRHLLPAAIAPQLPAGRGRELACALVCAGLFGLLHAGGAAPDDGGAAGTALALTAARFAQTSLFGLTMAGVAARRHGLAWAVALHALYDLVCLGGGALCAPGGPAALPGMPAEALLAAAVAPAGMAASLALLAPLAAWACRALLGPRPATPASA